jgi:aerobic carbon-monoxide dehydrogenase large subunit
MGAWLSTVGNLMGTGNFSKNIQSNYATPLLLVRDEVRGDQHHAVSAYRGAGRPEGNYYMERLIETAAREMGRDPIALRR